MSQQSANIDALRRTLLAELRCASVRAKLAQLDIDAVGVALSSGLIDVEQAIRLLGHEALCPISSWTAGTDE